MKHFTLGLVLIWILVAACAPTPSAPDVNTTVQAAVAATLAAPMAKNPTAQSSTTVAPVPTVATVSAPKASAASTSARGTPIPSPTPTINAPSTATTTITGVLVDGGTGKPLSGWSVVLGEVTKQTESSTKYTLTFDANGEPILGATTDEKGAFSIKGIPTGTYGIFVGKYCCPNLDQYSAVDVGTRQNNGRAVLEVRGGQINLGEIKVTAQ